MEYISPRLLKAGRALAGLTLAEMAERLHMPISRVCRHENAETPSLAVLAAMLGAIESQGVEFLPNGVGVRLRERRRGRPTKGVGNGAE